MDNNTYLAIDDLLAILADSKNTRVVQGLCGGSDRVIGVNELTKALIELKAKKEQAK